MPNWVRKFRLDFDTGLFNYYKLQLVLQIYLSCFVFISIFIIDSRRGKSFSNIMSIIQFNHLRSLKSLSILLLIKLMQFLDSHSHLFRWIKNVNVESRKGKLGKGWKFVTWLCNSYTWLFSFGNVSAVVRRHVVYVRWKSMKRICTYVRTQQCRGSYANIHI